MMPRIPGVDSAQAAGEAKAVFGAQAKQWGAPLGNHLLYARRPAIFRGARVMWAAM